jgi:hypothetical protein
MPQPKGEGAYNARLTEHDLKLIRQLAEDRRTLWEQIRRISERSLAEKFGVSQAAIRKVINRESWLHVR